MLELRRLDPLIPRDLATFASVFRGAPSFVFASEGRVPTDDAIVKMMNTMPSGYTADDMFIYEISEEGSLRGCAFMARGYPTPVTAYLVLLLVIESAQGKSIGRAALRYLEAVAKSWGCSSVEAVVDSANERALKFWRREGFTEMRRTPSNRIGRRSNRHRKKCALASDRDQEPSELAVLRTNRVATTPQLCNDAVGPAECWPKSTTTRGIDL